MKKTLLGILVFCFIGRGLFAQGISLDIKLVEQKIYFLRDEIDLKITIKNDSTEAERFRIADTRVFSFDFDVRTAVNRPEDHHSTRYKDQRNTLKPVFYRELSLAPKEEYSLILSLSDYVTLPGSGLYVIQAKFFPMLHMSEESIFITSNKLTMNIRPAFDTAEEKGAVEARLEKELQRDKLSPSAVVEYMLKARQQKEWSKFFLYINLEELYLNSHLNTKTNRDQFKKLAESEKQIKLNQYRNQIIKQETEADLVLLASDYKLVEAAYNAFQAKVVMNQTYQHTTFREPRQYTYILRLRDNIWEIVDYSVGNINSVER